MHAAWPPPDPPLLSSSAPLASQGRAQLGSHPSLGGPLSPSAQLIPPPAPQRRSILRVSARGRHGSTPMQRYVSRHRGHAGCVPAPAPDWLLAPGQTKWRARCGPCRSSQTGKCPFRDKGGPGAAMRHAPFGRPRHPLGTFPCGKVPRPPAGGRNLSQETNSLRQAGKGPTFLFPVSQRVSPLRRRPKGFPVALWKPSGPLQQRGICSKGDFVAKGIL